MAAITLVCDGYTITYDAVQKMPNGSLLPLPKEILFYPDRRVIRMKKCVNGDPNYSYDSECMDEELIPYTKTYQIVLIATLVTDI